MQYMLMCCFDETAWNNLPDTQKDKIMRDYGDWIQSLVNSGHFRGGAKLHPPSSTTTVRMKNGGPSLPMDLSLRQKSSSAATTLSIA